MTVWGLSCDESCADTVLRGRANRPPRFAFAITNAVADIVVPVPTLHFGLVGRFLASSGSWHQQQDLSLSLAFSYSRRQYKVAVACVTKNRPMISSSSSSSMLSPLSAVRESRKSHAAVSAKPTSRRTRVLLGAISVSAKHIRVDRPVASLLLDVTCIYADARTTESVPGAPVDPSFAGGGTGAQRSKVQVQVQDSVWVWKSVAQLHAGAVVLGYQKAEHGPSVSRVRPKGPWRRRGLRGDQDPRAATRDWLRRQ